LAILLHLEKDGYMEIFSFFRLVILKSSLKLSKSYAAIKFVSAKQGMTESPKVNKTPIFCIILKTARALFDRLFFFGEK
jgi:hypothetical protein